MSYAPQRSGPSTFVRVVVLVVAGIVLILGAKFLLDRPQSFEGNGVSFDYPGEWEEINGNVVPPAAVDLLWTVAFALDDQNGAGIGATNIGTPIPRGFLDEAAGQSFEPALREAVEAGGGSMTGPDTIDVAEREALIYRITGIGIGSGSYDVSVVAVSDGAIVYFIACQATPEHVEDVRAGCEQIQESFSIG